jgi:phosphate transport system permease protein
MDTGQVEAPEAPAPAPSWAAAGVPTASLRRRNLMDRLARWVVSAGGVAIIAGVLGIFVFIVLEVLPLLGGAAAETRPSIPLSPGLRPLAAGVDEHETMGFAIDGAGRIEFFSLTDAPKPPDLTLAVAAGRTVTAAFHPSSRPEIALGLSDGSVLPITLRFEVSFGESRRIITPRMTEGVAVILDPSGQAIAAVARQESERGAATAGITPDGRLLYHVVAEKTSMMEGTRKIEERRDLTSSLPGPATAVTMDRDLEYLYVGTRTGHLAIFTLEDPSEPRLLEKWASPPEAAAVTALALLIGEQSLIVGDARGRVRTWCEIEAKETDRGRRFHPIHAFDSHEAAVTSIAPSERDKGFATADAAGNVALRHATSEQTLVWLKGESRPVASLVLSPRATALFAVHEDGSAARWKVRNPHPEISLRTLFGPVWYEGYSKPEYVWQSAGSTDDFEPKFSLTPLIYGTLKGTAYALLFAVPLAILGAIYTALFMHPMLKAYVKPTVEVMAALPSVVLGFLAGLWLAPVMERLIPGIGLMFIVLPLSCLAAMGLFRLLPETLRHRHGEKLEIGFLIPALLVAGWICVQLNGPVERMLFGGDFRQWWYTSTGLKFDQRNALVVGFAMGFAVIPIIFTISEDSLSNVPRHLTSGSLALGATRWQTAIRVVLPAASPGIFSAIMIGFGRVVGETMIVLMATGNTPIMEWNPFNGFRTLSANIAVEIPEAPHGGSLYRTLFLGALLLFIATFIVNTAAELVRQRMRRRYAQL